MQLIIFALIAILIPSAYGQCQCSFPDGDWTGDAVFRESGSQTNIYRGPFYVKFKSNTLVDFKANTIRNNQKNRPRYWYGNRHGVRSCSATCTIDKYSFFMLLGCVPDSATKRSDENGLTTFETENGRERYMVTIDANDATKCTPVTISVSGIYVNNLYNYTNIKRDEDRPRSFFLKETGSLADYALG